MEQRLMIARLNIERYRGKLVAETDEAVKQTIVGLLAEEEANLAALEELRTAERKKG